MASVKSAAARVTSMTATDAKNEFGRVMDVVLQGGAVVITRHETPKAVLISFEEYNRAEGRRGGAARPPHRRVRRAARRHAAAVEPRGDEDRIRRLAEAARARGRGCRPEAWLKRPASTSSPAPTARARAASPARSCARAAASTSILTKRRAASSRRIRPLARTTRTPRRGITARGCSSAPSPSD